MDFNWNKPDFSLEQTTLLPGKKLVAKDTFKTSKVFLNDVLDLVGREERIHGG